MRVYFVKFLMKLCCSASNRILYPVKLVLQMALSFPQMFHGAVDMKPWSLLVLCYKIYGGTRSELAAMPRYSEPEEVETEKKCLKSHTD